MALLLVAPWLWFLVRDSLGLVTDVIATALPPLAVLVAGGALLVAWRWPRALVLAVSTLLAGAVAVGGPWLPADAGAVAGPGVTIVAANVDRTPRPADAVADLGADIAVVLESSVEVAERLSPRYPHRSVRYGGNPVIGVFSRYPIRLLEGSGPDLPGERFEVTGPDGPFVLYALHVPRPWFPGLSPTAYQTSLPEHRRLVEHVAQRAAAETLPVVVAGDLNSTDRSRDYRVLLQRGRLIDAMRDTVGGPTSVGKWTPLLARIDHVLVSSGWCGDAARRVEMIDSSHRAVTATVGPCAAP